MAIKVGGTEVVDNNRQLKNIASVDATTVTALSSAGVGGGGSAKDFVASGTIANGNVVKLNTDGTVSVTVGVDGVGSIQEAVNLGSNAKEDKDAVYDDTTNQVIVTYRDPNSQDVKYIVGLVTGTTITWGSHLAWDNRVIYDNHVELGSSGTVVFFGIHGAGAVIKVYQINSNQTLTYKSDASLSSLSGIRTAIGTSALTFNTAHNYAYCICTDNTTTRLHTMYINPSSNYAISQRDTAYIQTYNRGQYTYGLRANYDATADKTYAIWYDSNDVHQKIVNMSAGTGASAGQGISVGTELIFGNQTGISTHDVVYSAAAQKTFLLTRLPSTNEFILKTVTSSGSTISLSSATTIDSGSSSSGNALGYTHQLDCAYISSTNEVVVSARMPQSNNTGYVWRIGWSSNAPVISSPFQWTTEHVRENHQIAASSSGLIVYVFTPNVDSQWRFYGIVHNTAAINSAYGIAKASVSNGQTVEVVSLGSIAGNQSGLTIGSKYYYNADGAISTSGIKEVGVAVSATELLITGVVA